MDVAIRDADVSVIQVQGPKSPHLMARFAGDDLLDLKNYWWMPVAFEGVELIVSRTGWSGEFGYEVYLADAQLGDRLFDALMAAGRPFNVAPGSVNHIRRIESGILSWGVDMTAAETPYDVGLGRLVEFDSGAAFIGRQALERLAEAAPMKQLVGLLVDGEALAPNEDVWPVTMAGKPVGRLTSLAHSPRVDANIALALVERAALNTDGALSVETWAGARLAREHALPFLAKRQAGSARAMVDGSAGG